MTGRIVVVGSLNMDLVVRAPRHPLPGETLLGGDFRTFPGGKGANQAVAAARLGGFVEMVGRVGADDFGDALLRNLAANGVETRFVQRDVGAATGVALITVSDAGENTIVVASGANWRVSSADVSAAEPAFAGAQALLLQLETPLAAVERAVELARRHKVRVILNPAPAQPLERAFLNHVDFLIPNQSELALLTGVSDMAEGIGRLRSLGVDNVVATLGEKGAWIVGQGVNQRVPAHKVQVVDTTAAGDAFVGGFAVALSKGLPLLEAVRWGNAAGGVAVTRPGAQPSLPTRAELDALLTQQTT
jgi:ribokinase